MKRILVIVGFLLLFAGCSSMYPSEYISVQEHEAPFAYRETTAAPETTEQVQEESIRTVSRASDLRDAIQELVMSGRESGQFLLKNYAGDVKEDMKNMFNTLLSDSPKYTYAMDRFDWDINYGQLGVVVMVEMKLRLTPQELLAIHTRLFPEPAMSDIYKALREQASSFTVQVSGYQETDFNALLDAYILHHPDQIMEAPGISVAVYPPDRGNVRLVELHFVYHTDRDTLRRRRVDIDSFFNLVYHELDRAQSAQELVETLYKHLVPGIGYESSENATVYTQVMQKIGSSRTMASVAEYLCCYAGAECQIVIGEREGEPWYWNRILSDGQWRSFDLHAAAQSGEPPVLLPASDMKGYTWDAETYPEIETTEPTAPASITDETDEATEPSSAEEP